MDVPIQMFLLTIVFLVSSSAGENTTENGLGLILCDGVVFHEVYYDKETLFEGIGRPYNLVMHAFSGTLFFSHTIQNGSQIDFGIMACYIDKKGCRDVPGIPGGYAVAYDSENDDIYFGGHDGIYKYNFITKTAEFFDEHGKSVWGIFVRNNFYYIEYPTQKLLVYHEENFVVVPEAKDIEIDNFFISKRLDIYFANKTALYKVERPNKKPNVLKDEIAIRQIADDLYGDIYFCASDGIYVEDVPYHRVKRVAEIDQVFGIAFDNKDQIIYSDEYAIYRLVPSKYSDLCLNAIRYPDEGLEEKKQIRYLIS